MSSGVRLVKHGRNGGARSLPIGKGEKTHRQSDREIVSTVKSWIAELEHEGAPASTGAAAASSKVQKVVFCF